ncbi:MAG: ATP-binding cassette domain-containing protein [Candidatus Brocadiia bacterium]|jgi:phospholipid/cholesterol/gamma-HCH transport system ATP-binding protein
MAEPTKETPAHIEVKDMTVAYGDRVIQHDLAFSVKRGQVFLIMGGSGCGKSTVMRALFGLTRPARGQVLHGGVDFWAAGAEERERMMRRCGVLYQSGALWSSLTLAENISVLLETFTDLRPRQVKEIVSFKLALVGLAGFEEFYPSEISGGMRKRAGLARAMALDPEILFFDEPSAGLDPVSSRRLDELILELRDSLGATVVIVTHELASVFAIGDDSIFLDAVTKTLIAHGNPKELLAHSTVPEVRAFLTRGAEAGNAGITSAAP